jgi:hypothetical protein
MRIGLIPLDERPVNTRYPAMLARIAGVDFEQPPQDTLSALRKPAQSDRLTAWLKEQAATLDVLIVSVEMLGFGGLIASRITDESSNQILERLNTLREIKYTYPSLSIYGFDLITRISRDDNSFEEPLYWENYGSRLYRYSQLLDQQLQGQDVAEEMDNLHAQIPLEHIQDFTSRRLRNHIVNLHTLEMLKDGIFDVLVLSSDDTSEYGLGSREKRWLTEWVNRSLPDRDRLLMYPGADEVGCVLSARALNAGSGLLPRFNIQYAIPGDEEITAPFEDGPVRVTVERQVQAIGGTIVSQMEEADFIVAVNTPSSAKSPYLIPTEEEYEQRYSSLEPFVKHIQHWTRNGNQVIVTDVAYPNGADPAFVEHLRQHVPLDQLAAYGAWNTAGNTIGVALAQGLVTSMAENEEQKRAATHFLIHRFVEDWGYQYSVRSQLHEWLIDHYGVPEISTENIDAARTFIEKELQSQFQELPAFADKWRIVSGSIRLPWHRTFEVDFDLEHQ